MELGKNRLFIPRSTAPVRDLQSLQCIGLSSRETARLRSLQEQNASEPILIVLNQPPPDPKAPPSAAYKPEQRDDPHARLLDADSPENEQVKPHFICVADLELYKQIRFIKRYFSLLILILTPTLLASYFLLESHRVGGWIERYPWVLLIIGAVSMFFLLLYLTKWFEDSSLKVQLFVYGCVGVSFTAVITLIGTYEDSGTMFRVVAIVDAFVLVMLILVSILNIAFSPTMYYLLILAMGFSVMIGLVWLPNIEYFGWTPNETWLYPPGDSLDIGVTTVLSMYCGLCFVYSVTTVMRVSHEQAYIRAAIGAYIDLLKLFFTLVLTVLRAANVVRRVPSVT